MKSLTIIFSVILMSVLLLYDPAFARYDTCHACGGQGTFPCTSCNGSGRGEGSCSSCGGDGQREYRRRGETYKNAPHVAAEAGRKAPVRPAAVTVKGVAAPVTAMAPYIMKNLTLTKVNLKSFQTGAQA